MQNAIEMRDLGTGTAGVSFFRSMGGAIGVAILASVLVAGLNGALAALPPHLLPPEIAGRNLGVELLHAGPQALAGLAPDAQRLVVAALAGSFRTVFIVSGSFGLLGFLLSLFLEERPLRTSAAAPKVVE